MIWPALVAILLLVLWLALSFPLERWATHEPDLSVEPWINGR